MPEVVEGVDLGLQPLNHGRLRVETKGPGADRGVSGRLRFLVVLEVLRLGRAPPGGRRRPDGPGGAPQVDGTAGETTGGGGRTAAGRGGCPSRRERPTGPGPLRPVGGEFF